MDKIELHNVLPQVFANTAADLHSDVWLQENCCFEKGKVHLVVANSGTGKSTLCSYILGFRQDFTGQLLFDKEDVRKYRMADWTRIRQRSISHLFQELRLFPELTAMENVQIKNQLTGYKSKQQIEAWFEALGIPDKKDVLIGKMSFGQQQRVAMMRALVQPFDFVMVDEPISHLDETNSAVMAHIMMEEAQQQGAGVIVTSIGKHPELNYDKTYHL